MKRILQLLLLSVVGLSLVACGSRQQKDFEKSFNTALEQLADTDSITIHADILMSDDDTPFIIKSEFNAKDMQTKPIAKFISIATMMGTSVTLNETYVVDGVMYTQEPYSNTKIKQNLVLVNAEFLRPKGWESKLIVNILDIDNLEKHSDGSKTYSLSISKNSIEGLAKLVRGFDSSEMSSEEDGGFEEFEELLEQYKDAKLFITFGRDGNIEEILANVTSDDIELDMVIDVKQVNGDVQIELPSFEDYIEYSSED